MYKGKDITMYDLAKELNVSVATVSRALKDDPAVHKKTRKRIMDLATELGYQANLFARSLRTRETKTIGFMIHELNSNFINAVLAGVERVTARKDTILSSPILLKASIRRLLTPEPLP